MARKRTQKQEIPMAEEQLELVPEAGTVEGEAGVIEAPATVVEDAEPVTVTVSEVPPEAETTAVPVSTQTLAEIALGRQYYERDNPKG